MASQKILIVLSVFYSIMISSCISAPISREEPEVLAVGEGSPDPEAVVPGSSRICISFTEPLCCTAVNIVSSIVPGLVRPCPQEAVAVAPEVPGLALAVDVISSVGLENINLNRPPVATP